VLVVLPFGTPDAVLRPAEIPPLLAEAIVATEDERFCQHHGFIVGGFRRRDGHERRRPLGSGLGD
jgi:hypothetical protein